MIAIIDYNGGNVKSVQFALQRLGVDAVLTGDPAKIQSAEKVIFPGVGEASSTIKCLRELGLDQLIPSLKQPVLGICLGMQLMCSHLEEGGVEGFGIFPENVCKFPEDRELNGARLKVPHIGWNSIGNLQGPLFEGIEEGAYMYFVHSFFVEQGKGTVAVTDYTQPFSAALQHDNFYAVQFHPEKSGEIGEKLLSNFLQIKS